MQELLGRETKQQSFPRALLRPCRKHAGEFGQRAVAGHLHSNFCVLPISISFSITLGRIFQSWLKQCARTWFCFCGHLSLTAVDLLHSFLRALIFSLPACHANLFPRGLLGTCQAWGDRIREMNTPGCASVMGGGKAANQHALIFLQNNKELSLWLLEFPFQLFWSLYLFLGQVQAKIEALGWGNGMCGAAGRL